LLLRKQKLTISVWEFKWHVPEEEHLAAFELVTMPSSTLHIVICQVKNGRAAGYIRHNILRRADSRIIARLFPHPQKGRISKNGRGLVPAPWSRLFIALLAQIAIGD
jgi:hypothetical protein